MTAFHNVGIVASYSYNDTVKPLLKMKCINPTVMIQHRFMPTVDFAFVLHYQEGVIMDVAEELYVGPEILNQHM